MSEQGDLSALAIGADSGLSASLARAFAEAGSGVARAFSAFLNAPLPETRFEVCRMFQNPRGAPSQRASTISHERDSLCARE
ncbi:MAG TPA: hypothetical protein VMG39_04695 [Pseudolabrys sp.]|nr:hypothetical protein [Pseudolabrys sp.]